MIYTVTDDIIFKINNNQLKRYLLDYHNIENETKQTILKYGLDFDIPFSYKNEICDLKKNIQLLGGVISNNGKSIHSKWISSACEQCRTGEGSYTSFLSLKCHRDCYFCFNPNQENYEYFQHEMRDAISEVNEMAAQGYPATHIALTGGEPLLYRHECIEFFQHVRNRFPLAHTRLYTAGDPLDRKTALALAEAGLQEIRFSIKIDDPPERIDKILRRITLARHIFPSVMVEMPVIPNSEPQMYALLRKLDDIGIDGINLLEFCFPLTNSQAYQSRGFLLKNPPYEIYHNYWYAGGLAVSGSELACLRVLEFALNENLALGVHYCSLENKHTGQIYQSNGPFRKIENTFFNAEYYLFSTQDYFYKCAKVFDNQNNQLAAILNANNIPFHEDLLHGFIQFNPKYIPVFTQFPDLFILLASYIADTDNQEEWVLKEVHLEYTTPTNFLLTDIDGSLCE